MLGGAVVARGGGGGSNGRPVPNSATAPPPAAATPPPPPPPPPDETNTIYTAAAGSNISTMSEQTPAVGTRLGLPPSLATKKPVKYRECLKNHAASIGGHALDGCGEFMPSGEEGSLEALKCAACGCHRNFHRREVEGELPSSCFCYSPRSMMKNRKMFTPPALTPHTPLALPPSPAVIGPGAPPRTISQQRQHMNIMALSSSSPTDFDDQDFAMMQQAGGQMPLHHLHSSASMKKRFRTKFSSEQKDKMFAFAEKLGWRVQKHDESAVHQFCADVGVKRHVLKVWMHNNKNTFGKKISPNEVGVAYLDHGGSPTNSNGMQP